MPHQQQTLTRPTQVPNDERLYTFKEAMAYLRVSRSTLNRLLAAGKLTGHKVGSGWRFTKEELKTLVKPVKQAKQGV